MNTRKVVIIGAGHVGSHVALSLLQTGEADELVLIDCDKDKAFAQALDLSDAVSGSACGRDILVRTGEYNDITDADALIIAFGRSRRPGETRLDMFDDSIRMANEVISQLKKHPFHGIMLSISNPADIICEYIRRRMNWSPNRAFCTGTSLETYRLLRVLSRLTGVSRRSIQAFCMGEHGNSSFIVWSQVRIAGLSIEDFYKAHPELPPLDKDAVLEEVRKSGDWEVDGKGCTEFGIANATTMILKAVFHNQGLLWPCSTVLHGQYGEEEVAVGVPCILGHEGIQEVCHLPLTTEEQEQLHHSCTLIRSFLERAETVK